MTHARTHTHDCLALCLLGKHNPRWILTHDLIACIFIHCACECISWFKVDLVVSFNPPAFTILLSILELTRLFECTNDSLTAVFTWPCGEWRKGKEAADPCSLLSVFFCCARCTHTRKCFYQFPLFFFMNWSPVILIKSSIRNLHLFTNYLVDSRHLLEKANYSHRWI